MKKKILVWSTFPLLERSGGPSTYLYNLSKHLNRSNYSIEYLSDLISLPTSIKELKKESFSVKNELKKFVPKFIVGILKRYKSVKICLKNYESIDLPIGIDLNEYYAIHFHSTIELVKAKKILTAYKGKVVLTTHTPCPPYQHDLNHLNLNVNNMRKNKYAEIVLKDFEAFERADIFIFPCKDAISSYYEGYLPLADLKKLLLQKDVYYVTTGAPNSKFERSRNEVRSELSIPESAFVIHFAGRHNKEKGYDLLVEFGEKLLKKYPDVYFLITGNVNNAFPQPNNSRWIEVGWTTDPFSYANASDLFILPNRITYFDLVLIEMLALGLPVMISDVGGNKFYKDLKKEMEIEFFDVEDINQMEAAFNRFYDSKNCLMKNKSIYKEYLTDVVFANNYKKVYNLIYDKNGNK